METTNNQDEERRRKSLEGINRALNPRTIPGYVEACRLTHEANENLYLAFALMSAEPEGNLDRIIKILKVLQTLENTDMV